MKSAAACRCETLFSGPCRIGTRARTERELGGVHLERFRPKPNASHCRRAVVLERPCAIVGTPDPLGEIVDRQPERDAASSPASSHLELWKAHALVHVGLLARRPRLILSGHGASAPSTRKRIPSTTCSPPQPWHLHRHRAFPLPPFGARSITSSTP